MIVSDEVAVIDEIQMIGDKGRGWAWTRAILGNLFTYPASKDKLNNKLLEGMFYRFSFAGLQAEEIHLCGEAGAINLIEEICNTTGEEMEVKLNKALGIVFECFYYSHHFG